MEDVTPLPPPHLWERPKDSVRLAHWYVSGLHQPCRPGTGCPTCWDTLSAILDVAEQIPIEDMEDPETEKTAQDLLQIWYGQASTRIEVHFANLPSFDSRLVPSPRS